MNLYEDYQLASGTTRENKPEFIRFRAFPLTLAFGGGLQKGQVHEWYGGEGAGKSTIAFEVAANALHHDNQEVVIFDSEKSASVPRLEKFGLYPETDDERNTKQNMIWEPDVTSIENMFTRLERIINLMKSKRSNKGLFVVLDSLGALPPQAHLDATNYEKDLKIGATSLAWAQMLRVFQAKINRILGPGRVTTLLLNHQTNNINTTPGSFGKKYTSPGGHAVKHHAYTRARIIRIQRITNNDGQVIGAETLFDIEKNKQAPPYQKVKVPIYFGNPQLEAKDDYVGTWDAQACLWHAKDLGLVQTRGGKSGMSITIESADGEEVDEYFEWRGEPEFVTEIFPSVRNSFHRTLFEAHYTSDRWKTSVERSAEDYL